MDGLFDVFEFETMITRHSTDIVMHEEQTSYTYIENTANETKEITPRK